MTEVFQHAPTDVTTAPASQLPADDDLRQIMESRIRTFNPFRRTRMTEWNINLAYLTGHQYVGLNGTGAVTENPANKQFRSTVNKIAPAVRNDVAMATKVPPKFDVVPDTTDENDRATAIAGEEMLGYLRKLNDFDEQRGLLIMWYDIASIAWRKNYWNPFHKVVGQNPEATLPDGTPNTEHDPEALVGAPLYQGEALSEHTPTNEVIWDWRLNSKKLPWIIHARPMTFGELKTRFGEEKALTVPESAFIDPNTGQNEFEMKIFNQFLAFSESTGQTPKPDVSKMNKDDKQVMVYEFWQVIDTNYPEGVFSVMAGFEPGVVLQNAPYPIEKYPHGEVPFTAYDMMLPDKAVAGTASRISMARPLQDELNEVRTHIRENFLVMGGGTIYVPRDGKVNQRRMDNGPGLIVEYDGPYRPQKEGGVPLSGDAFAYQETIIRDINDIFSFPQVAQGKRPQGGPKSGVGVALLQEAATTQHSPIISQMDRRDEHAMRQLLSIAFANYQDRTFQIIGKDNQWTLFEFTPNSYSTNFNVHVRTGSSLPISKAIERDMTLGLLPTGLLGNPQDPDVRRRALETMDIGGLDKILRDNARATNFAKLEYLTPVQQYHGMLESGVPPEEAIGQIYLPAVNPFDNHDVHIIEHKNDLLDKFFEYLGTGDPGMVIIAQAMQAHYLQHAEILSAQQLQNAILTGQIKAEDIETSEEKAQAKSENESKTKE